MFDLTYRGYGCGALPAALAEEQRCLHLIPGVAEGLATGFPPSFDLSAKVGSIYQQGSTPACVVVSTAAMKGVEAAVDRGRWQEYDWQECYRAVGGRGDNPVPPLSVLEYVTHTGMRLKDSQERHAIASFAFTPQQSDLFVATIKASIAAGRPCVLATLLPAEFGWDSSGGRTPAYHQLCGAGYDETHVFGPNSWGSGWGRQGFWRLPWDYLTADNCQNDLCYAYTAVDAVCLGPALPAP